MLSVRGGESVEVKGVTVSKKAYGQYTDIVGLAQRWEVALWLLNNATTVKRLADGSMYYLWVSHGVRFVFIENEHVDEEGHFILVTVERSHNQGQGDDNGD